MRKCALILLMSFLSMVVSCTGNRPVQKAMTIDLELGEFGAFYTKINSELEFEEYSRTGPYGDIVVDLGKDNAIFVFWRGSSYLPFLQVDDNRWYVDEVIERNGDGTELMPDRTNAYSVVKIIEDGPEQVVVHWRYLPEFTGGNPQKGPSNDAFVDEYFYIRPDGSVRRTIREGTERIDAWRDPKNRTVQTFNLTMNGIQNSQLQQPQRSEALAPVEGNPVVTETVVEPAAWWKFNEAQGDMAVESVNSVTSEIKGNKSLWREGVSGTALQFDGYFSSISIPSVQAPKPQEAITLEGWVAIGAYPWSYVPIVQQADDVPEELEKVTGQRAALIGEEDEDEETSDFDFILKKEDDRGWFLGLDGYGNPTFKIRVGNSWEELIADHHLDRRTWYHLAATYDKATGMMKVYTDGTLVGEKKVAGTNIELSTKDVKIGKGKDRRPIRPVRMNTFSDSYSFDGLIDEVRIYDVALTPDQVQESYDLIMKNKSDFAEVDMDKRVLPEGEEKNEFGAYYTHLKFYDIWDNLWRFSEHPDVVVEFDELPTKFIFWRGVGYIPMMVNDKGQWYSNEFNETWNKSGGKGCQEPMSDKESYNNHARIIENTPARTVVHWRYPLIDVNHVMANFDDKTGWCDWSEWYYFIYPDGIAVKKMHLWTHGERNHEWQESMAIFGPDQHPEQIIHTRNALTMLNLEGDKKVYDWVKGPPDNVEEPEGQTIQYINYTGTYKPVTIGDFQWSNVYGGELTEYAVFPTWNHWPVGQMPSDGRYATYPDRTAHSSLTHVGPSIYEEVHDGPTPYYQKLLMEGMLDWKPQELVPLARSWMHPAKLSELEGAQGAYDPAQRAYLLKAGAPEISCRIDASKKSPLLNPAFVIKDWNNVSHARLMLDGEALEPGPDFRQGIVRDVDGSKTLVLWFEKYAEKPVSVTISGE